MLTAAKRHARTGLAALATLVVAGVSVVGIAVSASAQTPPPPDPLSQLLPQLLAPLQPILNQLLPTQAPAAPANRGPAGGAAPAATTNSGSGSGGPPIPADVYYHCAGGVTPLSFNRGGTLTTKPLLAAAPPGTVQATLDMAAPPFPVAGLANFRDDWGEYRSTPCPHLHQGNDIFADFGTPFVAPEPGTVQRFGFESTGGNSVYFAGDDGYSFYGAHLETFAPGLRTGVHMAAGTLLGTVGNTGDALGGSPHLHFQLYAPGRAWGTPEDPYFWLKASLETSIHNAGGIVANDVQPDATGPAPINPGSLVSSVLLVGGHIISQPTVPVLLFVILVVGTLVMSQTRTLKVVAERRKSRATGVATITEAPLARRPGKEQRRRAGPVVVEDDAGKPAWLLSAEAAKAAAAEAPKPSPFSRVAGSVGEKWARLPEAMTRISAPPSNGRSYGNSNGNGHANGHKASRNGSSGGASFGSWSPGATATRTEPRKSRSGK